MDPLRYEYYQKLIVTTDIHATFHALVSFEPGFVTCSMKSEEESCVTLFLSCGPPAKALYYTHA